jgi:hypothetical protein
MSDPDDIAARLGAAFALRGHAITHVNMGTEWITVRCGCGAVWSIAAGVDVDTDEAFRWFENPEACGAAPETMPRCSLQSK